MCHDTEPIRYEHLRNIGCCITTSSQSETFCREAIIIEYARPKVVCFWAQMCAAPKCLPLNINYTQ